MIIHQHSVHNALRNFNYLLVCEETGEALAIDPLDTKACVALAEAEGFDIRYIVNTHEHWDHIAGNEALVRATKAKVFAHYQADIPHVDYRLEAHNTLKVGRSIELQVLDTPGHTMSHVCLLAHTDTGPALFSGDTLFNAGCGNCRNGGDPKQLFHTFSEQLAQLPDETQLYPGHDYLLNNLRFALTQEPDNLASQALLHEVEHPSNKDAPLITRLAQERRINPFLRYDQPNLVAQLKARYPALGETPSAEAIFICLRELRDQW